MKVLTVAEAKDQLPALLAEALSGQIVRVQSESGEEFELAPMDACYDNEEWNRFENNCAKASS